MRVRRFVISTSALIVPLALVAPAAADVSKELQAEDHGQSALAVRGFIENYESGYYVDVELWPRQNVLEEAKDGEMVDTHMADRIEDFTGNGRFDLELDPEEIPDDYIEDEGLVNLYLAVVDDTGGRGTPQAASIRFADGRWEEPISETPTRRVPYPDQSNDLDVTGPDDYDPTQPDHDSHSETVSMASSDDLSPAVTLQTPDRGTDGEAGALSVPDSSPELDLDARELTRQATASSAAASTQCLSWERQWTRTEDVWAGDAWPSASYTHGAFEYKSNHSTQLGVAVASSYNGSATWERGGRFTRDSSVSGTWDWHTSARYFDVNYVYGYYERHCTDGFNVWKEYLYSPVYQTGGFSDVWVSGDPGWSKCANLPGNFWWKRDDTNGYDYWTTFGVRAASTVGFNMETRTGYSSTRTLHYYNTSSYDRKICGSQSKWPSVAPRVKTSN